MGAVPILFGDLTYSMPLAVKKPLLSRKGPVGTQQKEPASVKKYQMLKMAFYGIHIEAVITSYSQYPSLRLVITWKEISLVLALPHFQVPLEKKSH